MLCLCFYVFFNWPGDLKHLGSAGRQANKYIAPGGKFFMFFMYLILPMNQVSLPPFFTLDFKNHFYITSKFVSILS
jgi:hypothetical protein